MGKVFSYLLGAVFIAGFMAIIYQGLYRSEAVDCRQWEDQAKNYPMFYLTVSQDEQCRAHGIIISAPIKK